MVGTENIQRESWSFINMILRITNLELAGPYQLKVVFNNGTTKTVDISPAIERTDF